MDVPTSSVNRFPCAICTIKNRNCVNNCEYATYFPAEKYLLSYFFIKFFNTSMIINISYLYYSIFKYIFYRQSEYECAHEIFGTPNIIKMMRLAPEAEKHVLASSILMEGGAWKTDPVRGPFRMVQTLKWQIVLRKAYLHELEKKIKSVKDKTEPCL